MHNSLSTTLDNPNPITEQDILNAQKEWADGIVSIGQVYTEKGDYKARAKQHIDELYAYDLGEVLFKPTLASQVQFRKTFDDAFSYFIGGDIEEDNGFAITPWTKVRFGEQQIIINSDSSIAMGNYYFTPAGSEDETKVEYTFGYTQDDQGRLRINVHHSSLPYTG